MTTDQVKAAVLAFGGGAKPKLDNAAVSSEPEDQLRGPLEDLPKTLSDTASQGAGAFAMVGESSIAELTSRRDYAVTVPNALAGFIDDGHGYAQAITSGLLMSRSRSMS